MLRPLRLNLLNGVRYRSRILPLLIHRSFHHGFTTSMGPWAFSKSKKKKPNTNSQPLPFIFDSITPASSLDDVVLLLRQLYRSPTVTVTSKISKMKEFISQIIDKSPDNAVLSDHIQAINDALNFIEKHCNDLEKVFTDDDMIKILTSCIKNLSVRQIPNFNFIPVLYSKLSRSQTYKSNSNKKWQIVSIFVNYLLMSKNRQHLQKYIDLITMEDPKLITKLINICLNASEKSTIDPKSVLKLAEHYDFQSLKENQIMGDLFVQSLETSVPQLQDIEQMISIVDSHTTELNHIYFSLLKFCSDNGFDDVVNKLMQKISSFDWNSTNIETLDELMMICMKYQNPYGICDKIEHSETMSLLWKLYCFNHNDFQEFAEINKSNLDSQASIDFYNKLLQVCVYSDKSKEFIDEFDDYFQDSYGVSKDVVSYDILIQNSILNGDIGEAIALFDNSVEADFIDWAKDADGVFMGTVFNLFKHDIEFESDLTQIHILYNKIKIFGYQLDKSSMTSYFIKLMLNSYVGDALTLMDKELSLETDKKFTSTDYPEMYDTLSQYAITYKDDYQVNEKCYQKLDEFFHINYNEYYQLMIKFCDLNKPDISYEIFATMRRYAKEHLSPPPDEKMYIYLFETFGQLAYAPGINKLHLLLKVDMNVTPTIDVLNSALEAFTDIEELLKVRDLFDVVMALPQQRGLNSRTISIMLKCHTFITVLQMRNFWNNLSGLDYLPTRSNYKQYLIGHCYHDCFEELISLVKTWDEQNELQIDGEILQTLFNYTPSLEGKLEISEFAELQYKQIWDKVKLEGGLIEEEDSCPPLILTARDELLLLE